MVLPSDIESYLKESKLGPPLAYLDLVVEVRQALQNLLAAAEKAGNFLPGGIPEALELHNAIRDARRLT